MSDLVSFFQPIFILEYLWYVYILVKTETIWYFFKLILLEYLRAVLDTITALYLTDSDK